MIIYLLVLACAIAAILFLTILDHSPRPSNYPSGPKPFRYIGSFPYLFTKGLSQVIQRTMDLAKIHGKIYAFHFGNHPAVIINDFKTLKEAFQRPEMTGRPKLEAFRFIHDNQIRGIGTQEGEHWRQLRSFVVKQLREFGKKSIEKIIIEESQALIQILDEHENRAISTKGLFNHSSINVLWRIITGEPIPPEASEVIWGVIKHAGGSIKIVISALFIDFARIFPNISGYNSCVKSHKLLSNYIKNFIQIRKFAFSPENIHANNDNFIDAFVGKISTTTEPTSAFFGKVGDQNLIGVMYDLFIAGVETTSTTLCWLLLYLAVHPKKQEILQKEIDAVFQGKFPTLEDKPKLPYLESVIMETMRKSSVLPMGVFHSTTQDSTLGGYFIPKDTIITGNVYSIHHDPGTWGDPENFRPERFLSPDGSTFSKHEAAIPFSIGKRACPGEKVARDTLFFFVSSIFQRFSIIWNPQNGKPNLQAFPTYVLAPNFHELIFKRRE